MDLISNLGLGFDVALTPVNIFYCFVGVLLGTLVGVLPGIGPTGTVAILLPITFTFEPVTAEDDSPGRLIRMALVEPPYWAP